ncbi:MAG: hypothetical protein Q9208_000251 [Pyrenodesmia sp. 3 TL-2023]
MSLSNETRVDELMAQKSVEYYDTFSMVTIPGWSTLSEAQRTAVRVRLSGQQNPSTLDVGALHSALLKQSPSLATPPPDDEANLREAQALEERTRHQLLAEGCPPCYSASLEFPLQFELGPDEGVISYWKFVGGTELDLLQQQLSDWERFRRYQTRVRRYFLQRDTLAIFQERLHQRRRRHGLGESMSTSLLPDPAQQSHLETWVEFQDYHLTLQEGYEGDVQTRKNRLHDMLIKTGRSTPLTSEDTEEIEVLTEEIEYSEKKSKQHSFMLQWIEQNRLTMVADYQASIVAAESHDYSINTPDSIPSKPARGRPRRKEKSVQFLSPEPSGIKKRLQQRTLRPRKHNASVVTNVAAGHSSISQDQHPPKPQLSANPHTRNDEHDIASLSRPSEAPPKMPSRRTGKQNASRSKPSQASMPIQACRSRNPSRERAASCRSPATTLPSLVHKTRSGRVSKRPERFGFG